MIANIISTFDLDFILPISLVDENMKRAHHKNGLLDTKFWWKVPAASGEAKVAPLRESDFLVSGNKSGNSDASDRSEDEIKAAEAERYKELSISQILNGDESIGFNQGLFQLCQQYMALKEWPQDKIDKINTYFRFISDRAAGKIQTGASFIRDFIMNHPEYARDSKLTQQMNFDLMRMLSELNEPDSEARRRFLGEYA